MSQITVKFAAKQKDTLIALLNRILIDCRYYITGSFSVQTDYLSSYQLMQLSTALDIRKFTFQISDN